MANFFTFVELLVMPMPFLSVFVLSVRAVLGYELLTFMFAGHDTTASTLSWATHELLEHPEEMAALVAEVDGVLEGKAPTYADVFERLPKLRMFLNESLRLHPPVPKDVKQAVADDTLPDGTLVPAGTMVVYVP